MGTPHFFIALKVPQTKPGALVGLLFKLHAVCDQVLYPIQPEHCVHLDPYGTGLHDGTAKAVEAYSPIAHARIVETIFIESSI